MPVDLSSLARGIPTNPLPAHPGLSPNVPHAPRRTPTLTPAEKAVAVQNVLRYLPKRLHAQFAAEFVAELKKYGHIYAYRFRPTAFPMRAHPEHLYPARTATGRCILHMIMNNLDPAVAQFPDELVTYGGNGSVFSNWLQFWVAAKYLCEMTEEQTLAMYSGHPMGLFPSSQYAPRVVVTNGMVVPNYSRKSDYDRMYAMNVSQYGQMTAGSYCYIGPQGIVHGTTLTILNCGRKYLGVEDMRGRVFVSAGLGGMSGAQAKAAVICGAVAVIAEVNPAAANKRHGQGWVMKKTDSLDTMMQWVREARAARQPLSIAYVGNVVDVWQRFQDQSELLVDLGSDQTSCHNPFNGGYYPYQVSFDEANRIMAEDPSRFKELVQASLRKHIALVNALTKRGLRFFDYGNAFLLEASRAGADVMNADKSGFCYPSYVEDVMGDIFSLGFGPFRWICTSGDPRDLAESDRIAADVTKRLLEASESIKTKQQYGDNWLWITKVDEHKLVVGSQARILYSDAVGRLEIARAFNEAIAAGRISGPIVLSRDHHDVSGTDSPYRETSNIRDGSMFCADMAIQNVIGDAARGASWVSIHNGGGTGWGEATNGGFGMVLDGSDLAAQRARDMLRWDVNNGVARRAWALNDNAKLAITHAMSIEPRLKVTMPEEADPALVAAAFQACKL